MGEHDFDTYDYWKDRALELGREVERLKSEVRAADTVARDERDRAEENYEEGLRLEREVERLENALEVEVDAHARLVSTNERLRELSEWQARDLQDLHTELEQKQLAWEGANQRIEEKHAEVERLRAAQQESCGGVIRAGSNGHLTTAHCSRCQALEGSE